MLVVLIAGSVVTMVVYMFGAPSVDIVVPFKKLGPSLGCEHA